MKSIMKKKKFNPNAGNVEKGIEFFNSTIGDLSNVSMGEDMKLKENISKFDLESFDEITSGMIDNMSDENIDSALRFYNKVARALHKGNHPEKLIFYRADEYDFNLDQAKTIQFIRGEDNAKVEEFDGIEFVTDHYGSEVCFIFADEDDAIKVLNGLKSMDESVSINEEDEDKIDYLKLFDEFANTSSIVNKHNNHYEIDIYPDYQDKLTDEQAYEIVASDHPMDKFFEMIEDAYVDSEFYYTRDMFDEFNKFLKNKNLPTDYDEYDIMDYLDVNYPYDHFLDQEFNCRIIVDTGDKDYDYTLNPNYSDSEIENEKASIVWLAKQQGKTINDLNNAILGDVTRDKFLTSVYEEVENTSSHINALTFLCRATLREMIDFKENKSSITLNKPYMCGFFDPYSGGGSIMELVVDNVTITYAMVDQFVPDVTSDGYYSVGSVYGLTRKAYDTYVNLSTSSNTTNESLVESFIETNDVKKRIEVLLNMDKVMNALNNKVISAEWVSRFAENDLDAFDAIANDDTLYKKFTALFLKIYEDAQPDGLRRTSKSTIDFARKIDDILSLDEYITIK